MSARKANGGEKRPAPLPLPWAEKNKPCLGLTHRELSFVSGARFPLTSGGPRSKRWLTL